MIRIQYSDKYEASEAPCRLHCSLLNFFFWFCCLGCCGYSGAISQYKIKSTSIFQKDDTDALYGRQNSEMSPVMNGIMFL